MCGQRRTPARATAATVCRQPKSACRTRGPPSCSASIKRPALPQGDTGEDVTVPHAELPALSGRRPCMSVSPWDDAPPWVGRSEDVLQARELCQGHVTPPRHTRKLGPSGAASVTEVSLLTGSGAGWGAPPSCGYVCRPGRVQPGGRTTGPRGMVSLTLPTPLPVPKARLPAGQPGRVGSTVARDVSSSGRDVGRPMTKPRPPALLPAPRPHSHT